MKALIFLLSFLFCLISSFAQQSLCTQQFIQGVPLSAENNFTSVDEAKQIIDRIITAIGLKPNFEVREANVDNAAAVVFNRKRYILYNRNFISALNKSAGNEWASIGVLAHEIGHHLNGHTLDNIGSRPDKELEADEFSGFVLRRMGATLSEAQLAMKIIAGVKANATHPARNQRLASVAKGWNNAGAQISGRDIAVVKKSEQPMVKKSAPAPTVNTPVRQTVLDGKYIAHDVYVNSDAKSQYFITIRSHFVKVTNNQLYVLGNVAKTSSASYPYVIYDTKGNKLYIDGKGNLLSAEGAFAGYVKNHS